MHFRGYKKKGLIFMSRKARKNLSTSFFHVIVQGINKEYIFEKVKYKNKYLQLLKDTRKVYDIKIIAYVIMNNHVHILIYTENVEDLSKFMKEVNGSFARYYNYEENRVGYVFRDRFLSEPILNRRYLIRCIPYIHNNPVKAGLVKHCEDYLFSSYNDYINKSGFVNEKIYELVFEQKLFSMENYQNIHKDKVYYFMEYENRVEENMNEIIEELQDRYKVNWKNLIKEIRILEKIIPEIKERITISNTKLAKYLKISRYKLEHILINSKNDKL